MLFSVRLVSRQPRDIASSEWQDLTARQLRFIKEHYDQGKVTALYRETGTGVLAIYDVESAQEMDQVLAQMPMAPYFQEASVHAMWDMAPTLQSLEPAAAT